MVSLEGGKRGPLRRRDHDYLAARGLGTHLYPVRRDGPLRADAVDHARHDVHATCTHGGHVLPIAVENPRISQTGQRWFSIPYTVVVVGLSGAGGRANYFGRCPQVEDQCIPIVPSRHQRISSGFLRPDWRYHRPHTALNGSASGAESCGTAARSCRRLLPFHRRPGRCELVRPTVQTNCLALCLDQLQYFCWSTGFLELRSLSHIYWMRPPEVSPPLNTHISIMFNSHLIWQAD